MTIHAMQVGPIGTNCYLLIDEEASLCAVIDPGDDAARIAAKIGELGVKLCYILITHGHYDHTTAATELSLRYPEAELYIHAAELCVDGKSPRYFYPAPENVKTYAEGDTLTLGSLTIRVMETPGHSAGSVTLQVGDVLFCGDTLFAGSCGRTDLPGGDMQTILRSLRRLGQLPGDYHVLPGHMEPSTLSRERASNPYLREAMNS